MASVIGGRFGVGIGRDDIIVMGDFSWCMRVADEGKA